LVIVIKDWPRFLEHVDATRGIGMFQVIDTGEGILLRVKAGTIGYEEAFPTEDDQRLKERVKLLEAKDAMRVAKTVDDLCFFV